MRNRKNRATNLKISLVPQRWQAHTIESASFLCVLQIKNEKKKSRVFCTHQTIRMHRFANTNQWYTAPSAATSSSSDESVSLIDRLRDTNAKISQDKKSAYLKVKKTENLWNLKKIIIFFKQLVF